MDLTDHMDVAPSIAQACSNIICPVRPWRQRYSGLQLFCGSVSQGTRDSRIFRSAGIRLLNISHSWAFYLFISALFLPGPLAFLLSPKFLQAGLCLLIAFGGR